MHLFQKLKESPQQKKKKKKAKDSIGNESSWKRNSKNYEC